MELGRLQKKRGITLIALIITIIVMLILAGIVVNLAIGDRGIFHKSKEALVATQKAQIKEELELRIMNLQAENYEKENITKTDILEDFVVLDSISGEIIDNTIEGEYKGYGYIVKEDNTVIVGEKLQGEVPLATAVVLTTQEEAEEVEIQVTGTIHNGEIIAIEPINGAELKVDKGNTEKIFKVIFNGTYRFIIRANNGRTAIASCTVTNAVLPVKDIFTAIKDLNNSGKIRVNGKTNDGQETSEVYSLNMITHEGDLVLDGQTAVEGATLSSKVYSFGDTNDIATASTNAKNTVVLKVDGNLTIDSGVTLTTISGTYGGPKGMIIYCTGTFTNNGTISMTARGAKALGQNVYLYQKDDNKFEYIPAVGGAGAARVHCAYGGESLKRALGGAGQSRNQ